MNKTPVKFHKFEKAGAPNAIKLEWASPHFFEIVQKSCFGGFLLDSPPADKQLTSRQSKSLDLFKSTKKSKKSEMKKNKKKHESTDEKLCSALNTFFII